MVVSKIIRVFFSLTEAKVCLLLCFFIINSSCTNNVDQQPELSLQPLTKLSFDVVPREQSGIEFINKITEGKKLNYFTYPNIYSGGGVAVGDINNDGFPDIYFSGNMVKNKLYLNKGNMQFEDITDKAKVDALDIVRWTRGVTMVDINNDGFLDIYVSVSDPPGRRNNLLYVNQGNMTFKEEGAKYQINDNGNSVQSIFFDYDKDGDLDLYICTYPPFNLYNSNAFFKEKNINPSLEESDRLYRNEGNGIFTEITSEAGILNYGLTLNASITDFNGDGWPDIYVSNDFNAKDFLYINNKNGTFSDRLEEYFPHTSNFGMGTDTADFNNDGYIDLFQSDMMADNNIGKKTNMSAMSPEIFHETVEKGLHYQYMKNCLQLNNGNNSFSDISELAGVANTDWSWAPLFADLNNDGWKDLFVSNGIRRNVNNNDYLEFSTKLYLQQKITKENQYKLVNFIPENPLDNYVFVNNGGLKFDQEENNWGLSFKGYTHGVAYADFDLDGDLDMVLNNQDHVSLVFQNNARQIFSDKNYLRLKFNGGLNNRFGIGTKVTIATQDGSIQTQELILSRGYQSSVEPVLHFGIGEMEMVHSMEVTWPDGNIQTLKNLKANQDLIINKTDAQGPPRVISSSPQLFRTFIDDLQINYKHKENDFNDFKRESLLPHKMSQFGPALAVGDINGDQLDDIYIGGAKGQNGYLFIQQVDGRFKSVQSDLFDNDKKHEDVNADFFDADNDGDLDLYVVSGGNEEKEGSDYYLDRFYENKKGTFVKNMNAIPKLYSSGSCIIAEDYDNDGDTDLFIGGRQVPGKYPLPASGYLLKNNSNHKDGIIFKDVTKQEAPVLKDIGMITDAKWVDVDNDNFKDLIVVGEWMPITIIKNEANTFQRLLENSGLSDEYGWWNTIATADYDRDGDIDMVVGNLGLNYKYKASKEHPFKIYLNDFDKNKTLDIVLSFNENGNEYPLRGRECSSEQMPFIKKKFKSYTAFANASLTDVFGEEKLKEALRYEATNFETSYIENLGNGKFRIQPLDPIAQISSVNSIVSSDFDTDGNLDLLLFGNLLGSEVETPRNDASYGVYLKGDGKGGFKAHFPYQSGLSIKGEVKQAKIMRIANTKNKEVIVLAINDAALEFVNIEPTLEKEMVK